MEFNLIKLIFTVINVVLFVAIIMVIVTGVKKIRSFMNENKEMYKKVDYIYKKMKK